MHSCMHLTISYRSRHGSTIHGMVSVDGVDRGEVQANAIVADHNVLVESHNALLVCDLRELHARSIVNLLLATKDAHEARVLLLAKGGYL